MLRLLCLALLTVPASALTLSVDLGETNRSDGLAVPSAGDGTNEATVRGGRPCRIVAGEKSNYLYIQIDDARLHHTDVTLYVTVDLWDDGPQLISVQYDHVAATPDIATCYTAGPSLAALGSGKWVRRTSVLEHARCGNGQNHGADLRLAGRAAVARIEISDQKPAGYDPDEPVPADELAAQTIRIGDGMELCLGNDADPNTALLYKAYGVTSVESYVTWQTVEEAGPGQWDWSHWDKQVAVLQKYGLKWVPFLIAGPAYANPGWFRNGPDHHPYVCLDHGQPSKVESLWNPALRPQIERFLKAFADRYRDTGVIESVLLGVTGIYGESIYPAGPEGGWTASIPGPYHNHAGWWAGDELAIADFRRAMTAKHGTIAKLNAAWGTAHAGFGEVTTFLPANAPNDTARLDLVRWYEQAMTDWSAWWVEVTRRQFPETAIYLCTGGNGAPMLGADFTAQAKAIRPFGAGIRITNEGSNYAHNYAVTREVATATRFYGTFCGFEPASSVSPEGVVARVYNATASGAKQLHYYRNNVFNDPAAAANFRRVASQLQRRTPALPKVAVYLPRETWAVDPATVEPTYHWVRALRELADLDLVNRQTVADGILRDIGVLLLPYDRALDPAAGHAIDAWVAAGGILAKPDATVKADLVHAVPDGSGAAELLVDIGAAGDEPFLVGDWSHRESGGEFPTPGATKRWSGARPGLALPLVPGAPQALALNVFVPPHALQGASGEVRLNGHVLGKLQPGHQLVTCPVPAGVVTAPVATLTFDIAGWQPSRVGQSTDDRVLGIAVSTVQIFRPGQRTTPVVNRGLKLALDAEALPLQRSGRGAVVKLPAAAGEQTMLVALQALLGDLAPKLGRPGLLLDPEADQVFVTAFEDGLLWLNMNAEPVERGGITIEAFGIGLADR